MTESFQFTGAENQSKAGKPSALQNSKDVGGEEGLQLLLDVSGKGNCYFV